MTDRTHPDSGRIITSSDILLHDAKTALMYEELRAAIDDGHESMSHADALAEIAAIRAENVELRAKLEAIGAGGVSGPLMGQPQAVPDLSALTERGAKAWAGVDAQKLREGFTAADMATAAAQGFRDGVASIAANAEGPVVNRATVIEWLDANDIEVTDRQLGGLFHFSAPPTSAEVLGHERPEWSSSYGRADALNDVQERMTALHKPAVDKAWGQFQSAMAAPQPAPAPLSEMPYEKRKAIQEGEQIGASDAWFKARHEMLDTVDRRNVFRAGFDRGWNAAIAAQGGKV